MTLLNKTSTKLKHLINISILIISLYSIFQKKSIDHDMTFFQKVIVEIVAPVQRSVIYLKESMNYLIDHYLLLVKTGLENDQLKKKMATLERTIFNLKELKRENIRLKAMLRFGKEIPMEKILAQIVAWDVSNDFNVIRINKGAKDGIKIRSTVITDTGLVGHVTRLSNNYSDILTIIDQNSRIDAIIDRTRSHGIVQGYSKDLCIMKYVTRTEPVKRGDMVITAGLGNIYPKGLRVGQITNIEKESYGITQRIEITPSADFKKIEEVVILVKPRSTKRLN